MGHITIVYGNIIGATWRTEDYHKLQRLNKDILDALADSDTFPWIHRNMFLCQDPNNIQGTYRDQVIVFGASYKGVEEEWDEWLEKFEIILRQLYWTSAKIHLETEFMGTYTYEWTFDLNQKNNWTSENPTPTTMWEFKGEPRKF
jgi:hypothetical protein